nr:autotransporter domain-containing protein [Cetobacterium sp. 2A]
MSYLTIKPKENEWIIQGKGIYTGVKNDNASSGKNYYGFDTGHRNYKTTTSTSGGLATFEYGLSDKTSIGGVIGGNNQDINFKGSSKIKGNSLYLGTFAKTDINNFKLMAGLGYQYTAADADRSVSNMYDSFKTSDKYDINSLNAFAEVKYSIEGNDNWTLEPKARLSYYYIEQDNVNEGYTPGQLSIAVDKANSNTADLELVIDLIKNVYLQQGKLKNIFSFGIINTIGDKSKELNGYVLGNSKDGNKFDIQGVELPRTSGKVAYNLELEQTSGMIYTAGVSMEFAKDYNRNASATIGLGYKFNSISDLIPSQTQKTKIEKINIIKIDSNVTFDFDSSNLKVNQREELKKISENLSKESVKGQIKIVGHTDNIGSKDYNQKLSEKRAKVVATKLKSNMKLENIQYDIKGEGETKPLNSNSTKKERSENRRVEVIFSNEN